jgi:hypothetical protein
LANGLALRLFNAGLDTSHEVAGREQNQAGKIVGEW